MPEQNENKVDWSQATKINLPNSQNSVNWSL